MERLKADHALQLERLSEHHQAEVSKAAQPLPLLVFLSAEFNLHCRQYHITIMTQAKHDRRFAGAQEHDQSHQTGRHFTNSPSVWDLAMTLYEMSVSVQFFHKPSRNVVFCGGHVK